jgi:hypothetical protein
MWKTEGREKEKPFRGWLNTPIPLYTGTMSLELSILTQPVGRRPHFEVVDNAHPLAVEQRNGITMTRKKEIAEAFFASSVTAGTENIVWRPDSGRDEMRDLTGAHVPGYGSTKGSAAATCKSMIFPIRRSS